MSDTLNALRREALCNGFGREYPKERGCMIEHLCPCARQAALMDALEREMAEMLKTIEGMSGMSKPPAQNNAQEGK